VRCARIARSGSYDGRRGWTGRGTSLPSRIDHDYAKLLGKKMFFGMNSKNWETMRVCVVAAAVIAPVVIFFSPSNAASQIETKKLSDVRQDVDDLRKIFLELFKNPVDLQLNILYAKLAEKKGKLEAALVTYERLTLLDPNNEEWKRNIDRIRDLLQPSETTIAVVLGAKIDTNGPLNADNVGNRAEYNASAVLVLDDERSLGRLRYQTTGQLYADYNLKESASDLIVAALQFGPLLRATTSWQVRPAIQYELAITDRDDRDLFSNSAGTLFNFENLDKGLFTAADISLYYVDFDDETSGKDAVVFTSFGEFVHEGFREADQVTLTPDVTFNGARSGQGSDGFRDQYYELGLDIAYVTQVSEDLEIGPIFSYYYRDYTDYEPGGSTERDDHNFNIGLEMMASNVIPDTMILLNYSFERNKSSLETETYRNHSIGINFIRAF
jgi:hypothetical protein